MRVVGAGFLLAAAGFLAVAFGTVFDTSWWRALLPVAALFSLLFTGLDWHVAYAGGGTGSERGAVSA